MMAATTAVASALTGPEIGPPFKGLGDALARLLRPAIGFNHPFDVLKDPLLDAAEKRSVLSSWASDACAVQDRPDLRWYLGTEAPVPIDDVLQALAHLDLQAPQAQ
jgi:hypothetical protein